MISASYEDAKRAETYGMYRGLHEIISVEDLKTRVKVNRKRVEDE